MRAATLPLPLSTQRLSVYIADPPYRQQPTLRPLWVAGQLEHRVGRIFLVECTPELLRGGSLETTLRQLQSSHPATPIGLALPPGAQESSELVPLLSQHLPSFAVAVDDPDLRQALRQCMCDPQRLESDVIQWLLSIRGGLEAVAPVLGRLFRDAGSKSVRAVVEERDGELRATRQFFQRRFPSPSRFIRFSLGIRAINLIQFNPDSSLQDVAESLGYETHGAVSHLLRREFRCSASEVRACLGWQPFATRRFSRWMATS